MRHQANCINNFWWISVSQIIQKRATIGLSTAAQTKNRITKIDYFDINEKCIDSAVMQSVFWFSMLVSEYTCRRDSHSLFSEERLWLNEKYRKPFGWVLQFEFVQLFFADFAPYKFYIRSIMIKCRQFSKSLNLITYDSAMHINYSPRVNVRTAAAMVIPIWRRECGNTIALRQNAFVWQAEIGNTRKERRVYLLSEKIINNTFWKWCSKVLWFGELNTILWETSGSFWKFHGIMEILPYSLRFTVLLLPKVKVKTTIGYVHLFDGPKWISKTVNKEINSIFA